MQFSSMNSVSPSFTGNSSNNLADIAARVVEEFRNENGHEDEDDIYGNQVYDPQEVEPVGNCVQTLKGNDDMYGNQVYDTTEDEPLGNSEQTLKGNEDEENEDGEFEFEFDVVCRNPNLSPVSADEIFSNGEILPRYPLFDRSLLLDYVKASASENSVPEIVSPVVRNPLRKLFREERSCCTFPETSNPTPGTYCIWKPKVESPEKCKKSNSTGNTSKRWKLRNLLQRSNSESHMADGKSAPVVDFRHVTAAKKKGDKTAKVAGADDDGQLSPVTHDNNSTNKGGNRLRSYLWHKRDQIGVSANVSR